MSMIAINTQPFKDRRPGDLQVDKDGVNSKEDPNKNGPKQDGTTINPCAEAFYQGKDIKVTFRAFKGLLPFISSGGIKAVRNSGNEISYVQGNGITKKRENLYVIDYSLEQNQYGISTRRVETRDNISSVAFNDISTLNDPVAYLKDNGMTAYPQVYLDPDWTSPIAMNGVIEPLDIRGTIAGVSISSPFIARSIKASLMDRVTPYYVNESFNRGILDRDVAFIDSQELSFSKENFQMYKERIGDFGRSKISPYDETIDRKISNDLRVGFTNDDFSDTVGIGLLSRGASTTMSYNSGKIVERGKTGIRNRNNLESVAFGGLLK